MTKKKAKGQINEVIKTNTLFNEYLEHIVQKYPFDTQDELNLLQLQDHLVNMNVHFVEVLNNIK